MILVLGSCMMDLIVRTDKFPEAGETIFGNSFQTLPGGKGANQAVQIKRLGGNIILTGKIGSDSFGDAFISVFKKENMCLDYIYKGTSNGIGSISIDKSGQNKIIVIPGANMEYTVTELLTHKDVFGKADIFLSQLEMPLDVITEFGHLAKKGNKTFVLNPAPAKKLSNELLSLVDYLTPNETELEILTGIKVIDLASAEQAARSMLDKGVKNVIVTLGVNGSLFVNKESVIHQKAFKVKAIDTVAAGDSYNGALCYALDNGYKIKDALELASKCSALTVTKEGAIPALPTIDEVKRFI